MDDSLMEIGRLRAAARMMEAPMERLRDFIDLYAVAPTPGVVRDLVDAARAVLAEHDSDDL